MCIFFFIVGHYEDSIMWEFIIFSGWDVLHLRFDYTFKDYFWLSAYAAYASTNTTWCMNLLLREASNVDPLVKDYSLVGSIWDESVVRFAGDARPDPERNAHSG